jgi:hypothetical protein
MPATYKKLQSCIKAPTMYLQTWYMIPLYAHQMIRKSQVRKEVSRKSIWDHKSWNRIHQYQGQYYLHIARPISSSQQLHRQSRNSPRFKAEGSLPCSQQHTNSLCPEPDNPIHPVPPYFLEIHFNIIPYLRNWYVTAQQSLRLKKKLRPRRQAIRVE